MDDVDGIIQPSSAAQATLKENTAAEAPGVEAQPSELAPTDVMRLSLEQLKNTAMFQQLASGFQHAFESGQLPLPMPGASGLESWAGSTAGLHGSMDLGNDDQHGAHGSDLAASDLHGHGDDSSPVMQHTGADQSASGLQMASGLLFSASARALPSARATAGDQAGASHGSTSTDSTGQGGSNGSSGYSVGSSYGEVVRALQYSHVPGMHGQGYGGSGAGSGIDPRATTTAAAASMGYATMGAPVSAGPDLELLEALGIAPAPVPTPGQVGGQASSMAVIGTSTAMAGADVAASALAVPAALTVTLDQAMDFMEPPVRMDKGILRAARHGVEATPTPGGASAQAFSSMGTQGLASMAVAPSTPSTPASLVRFYSAQLDKANRLADVLYAHRAVLQDEVTACQAERDLALAQLDRVGKQLAAQHSQLGLAQAALEGSIQLETAVSTAQAQLTAVADENEELRSTNSALVVLARVHAIEDIVQQEAGAKANRDDQDGAGAGAGGAVDSNAGQSHSADAGAGASTTATGGAGSKRKAVSQSPQDDRDASNAIEEGQQASSAPVSLSQRLLQPWKKPRHSGSGAVATQATQAEGSSTAGAGASSSTTPKPLSLPVLNAPALETILLDCSTRAAMAAKIKQLQNHASDQSLQLRVAAGALKKAREEAVVRAKTAALAHAEEVRSLKAARDKDVQTLQDQVEQLQQALEAARGQGAVVPAAPAEQ